MTENPAIETFSQDDAQRRYERSFAEEMKIALAAMDCAINGRKVAYLSSPLTGGPRFYALLRQVGVKTSEGLKARLGEEGYNRELLGPNATVANTVANQIRERLGGRLVVTPAPFMAPGWSQKNYLTFWETFIRERVSQIYFNEGWEYSNGCVFEYWVAADEGLQTFDVTAHPLPLANALKIVDGAVERLEADGVCPAILRAHVARLRELSS